MSGKTTRITRLFVYEWQNNTRITRLFVYEWQNNTRITRLCLESANICQGQNLNKESSGIQVTGNLVWLQVEPHQAEYSQHVCSSRIRDNPTVSRRAWSWLSSRQWAVDETSCRQDGRSLLLPPVTMTDTSTRRHVSYNPASLGCCDI